MFHKLFHALQQSSIVLFSIIILNFGEVPPRQSRMRPFPTKFSNCFANEKLFVFVILLICQNILLKPFNFYFGVPWISQV